jgi:transposase
VKEPTASHIGLDIHKEFIALAIADADRAAPRFIGTINPVPAELCKAMRRVCTKESTLIVYEAGPCGYFFFRAFRRAICTLMVAATTGLAQLGVWVIRVSRSGSMILSPRMRNIRIVWGSPSADSVLLSNT